jgi:hypothetical protein
MGKEKPDVLFSFPVKESHFNNKLRTGCVQGLDLDILAGQSVAYPNFLSIFVLSLFQKALFGAMWVSHCPNFSEAGLAQNAPTPYPVPAFGRFRPLLRASLGSR